MDLSAESWSGLKRHFLGALTQPSTCRVVPVPGPRFLLTSDGPLQGVPQGCLVDLGEVEPLGKGRRTVRVVNLGSETLTARIRNTVPWLEARWSHGRSDSMHVGEDGAELELIGLHDSLEEKPLASSFQLLLETLTGERTSSEILVRLASRRSYAHGRYDFDGTADPHPCDFGALDLSAEDLERPRSCRISFQDVTKEPLRVCFSNLPGWLVFEVDGFQRKGPVDGRFFERTAPFEVEIRPVLSPESIGHRLDYLLLQTNDGRPSFKEMLLEFSAEITSTQSFSKTARFFPGGRTSMKEATKGDFGSSSTAKTRGRMVHQAPPLRPAIAVCAIFAILTLLALLAFAFQGSF